MQNPTFRLEGIVKSKGELEDFEGPLTLILQLLSRNRIEIRDVKISDILGQYLDYLDRMQQLDLEIASEFIAMASHLMYIKTKAVLAGDEEQISELDQLIDSLERLKNRESFARLKETTAFLELRAENAFKFITRPPEPVKQDREYRYEHEVTELLEALGELLGRERDGSIIPPSFMMPSRLSYPVGEKAEEIMLRLREKGSLSLRGIFAGSRDRSELVASFMAVLELVRNMSLELCEDEGGELMVKYTGLNAEQKTGNLEGMDIFDDDGVYN